MHHQVILIHPAAPAKPPPGVSCNGCGVCCLAEPCPLGMLVGRRTHGACAAVQWDGVRYRCGLAERAGGWLGRLVRRSIGAGRGCDSSAEVAGSH
ncbi:MAG: hypothetical protein OEW27_02450 [Aquincola sp.]|nr:hypothetical protein [Aquincola sp.]MDH5328788.1 hypothetical protein [Aquincola sp.]